MKNKVLIFLLFFIVLISFVVSADTITVCKDGSCDYRIIQSAINVAMPGDIVHVTDKGVYNENIGFGGFDGKEYVTLNCDGATLSGNGESTGIFMSKGRNSVIKNCIIKNYVQGIRNWDGVGHSFINNILINNTYGFFFDNADRQKLIRNTISYNIYGIYFFWLSSGNVIDSNILEYNQEAGITIDWDVHDSLVKNNIVKGNKRGIYSACAYSDHPAWKNEYIGNLAVNNTYGFFTCLSNENLFKNNIAQGNYYGFYINGNDNSIYHNNIIDNFIQAYSIGKNYWNYNRDGNYWSDYDEESEGCIDENEDEKCDLPYIINSDNKDNYPLVNRLYFIAVNSPVNGGVYDSRDILLDISLRREVKALYGRMNDGNWHRLCRDCSSFSRNVSFSEGENNLIIVAITDDERKYFEYVSFSVNV